MNGSMGRRILAVTVAGCSTVALLPAVAHGAKGTPVTVAQIAARAPVPAACEMPATTVTKGVSPKQYLPRRGELLLTGPVRPVSSDLNRDGVKELAAVYDCNAGGVQWPNVLVVYKAGRSLMGSVDLTRVVRSEHANVTWWAPAGGRGSGPVNLSWVSYEGAGSQLVFHWSALQTSGGKVVLKDRYAPASANTLANRATDAFLRAAVKGDRATMRRMASPKALAEFAKYGQKWSSPSRSSVIENGGTSTPVTQAVVVSGRVRPNNYGLIFDFSTDIAPTGAVRITDIAFRGDAG